MTVLLDAAYEFANHGFENDLTIPDVIDTSKRKFLTLQVRQTEQFLGLYGQDGDQNPDNDQPLDTAVWGYGSGQNVSYPGPTILAYEGEPLRVFWQNHLPVTGHLLPIDTSLHIADPEQRPLDAGFVPIVTHLHGGHSASSSDGLPEAWFTQAASGRGGNGPQEVGPDYQTDIYTYDNDQHAATLWYHDHTLGMTRLNVYAGLAGFYVLQDDNRLELVETGILPGGSYDLGLAIQDRAFTADGQLYYPAFKNDVLPGTTETVGDVVPQAFYDANGEDAPSAVPEFFGDTILVNGMAWPNLDVAAGDYQFRLLNGSDSRFYVLKLSDPNMTAHLVGVDGGLLPEAQTIFDGDGLQEDDEFLVLAPGDRADLVFDFSKLSEGATVRLENIGPAFEPFKGLAGSDGSLAGGAEAADPNDPVGNIMQFTVNTALPAFDALVQDGTPLTDLSPLAADTDHNGVADQATWVRKVGLFEGEDEFGRINPLLGTAEAGKVHSDTEHPDGEFGPLQWDAPTTEKPLLGSTEQWEFFNFTEDAHPMHVHLTQFQAVEKRVFDFRDEDGNGIPDDTNGDGLISYGSGAADFLQADIWIGDAVALRPEESGWQDTIQVGPHEMLAIVATFDRPGDYVWHCHILSHEDHEMMRPYTVVDPDLVI